jgi:hypothetical protein
VTCRTSEEWILESLDSPLPPGQARDLEHHVAGCDACRRFQDVQTALDRALAQHYTAVSLNRGFRQELTRRVAAERRRTLWAFLPDLLHLGGGLATTAACALLLPDVWMIGLVLTILTYGMHTMFRSCLDQLDGV